MAQVIWSATADWVPAGGRHLSPDQLHITLAFLGSIDETQQQCMRQAASAVSGQRFTLQLDQAGHFPRPQVVWLGASHTPSALQQLQTKLVGQLIRECGFEPETRPFVPHITAWRKVKRVRLPEQIPVLDWPIYRFVLAASRTLPTGAEYSIVQEWPLTE